MHVDVVLMMMVTFLCSTMGNLSGEIPGYANMVSRYLSSCLHVHMITSLKAVTCELQTPAERVRAKLKVMLEKTTDKEQKSEVLTVSITPPSAADIAKIEGDVFEPASFVSYRTAKKQVL